ncbi:hypothetical protein [Bacteroides pyogenes]|uniref:hypothetical protein n=1 Tax=Bacteroides pyogenes TaxID=310300 RepID=UPI001F1F86A3|nr:hypothetical protein [Bacteroides pyogenes]MCF2709465.1 hypothetical protein [Bacteroides pyogenes]
MKKKTFILLLLSGSLSCQAQAWKTLKSVLGKSIELNSKEEDLFNEKLKTNEQVKEKENYLGISGAVAVFIGRVSGQKSGNGKHIRSPLQFYRTSKRAKSGNGKHIRSRLRFYRMSKRAKIRQRETYPESVAVFIAPENKVKYPPHQS